MANQTILTYGAKLNQVGQAYYSPVVVTEQNPNTPLYSIYCVLAKNDPWDNEDVPPTPTEDQQYIKGFLKKVFVAKSITSNQISPVIQRINWTSGTTYTYYQDNIDILAKDSNGFLVYYFYVKNVYDQVFKCLWNNNGQSSTVEPYFEPGTYSTNNIFEGADGYKWKYIYTIDIGSKVNFMDSNWMPIKVGNSTLNPLISAAGTGNIDVINVINGGSGYDPANSVISISILGDGTASNGVPYSTASASAVTSNGVITNIVVSDTGKNYSYANVSITSSPLLGTGAIAIAPTSPIGGHGFDPISELGCNHVMFTTEFNGSENGIIPTDIIYHQLGIIINPIASDTTPNPANSAIYDATTQLIVAPGFGVFSSDELIYQGSSLENATFIGTMLSFDTAGNVVKLINTSGTLSTNATIYGNTSKTARTLLAYNTPKFIASSGYVAFIENRTGVQRSSDGIEQYKIVISY